MKCLFNPGQCFADGVDSLLSIFPFGAYGVVFIAALIIGAILGKWGVAALIAAIVAVKVGSSRNTPEPDWETGEARETFTAGKPVFQFDVPRKPKRTAKRTPVKPYEPPKGLT